MDNKGSIDLDGTTIVQMRVLLINPQDLINVGSMGLFQNLFGNLLSYL